LFHVELGFAAAQQIMRTYSGSGSFGDSRWWGLLETRPASGALACAGATALIAAIAAHLTLAPR
jgi:hypothetical protein